MHVTLPPCTCNGKRINHPPKHRGSGCEIAKEPRQHAWKSKAVREILCAILTAARRCLCRHAGTCLMREAGMIKVRGAAFGRWRNYVCQHGILRACSWKVGSRHRHHRHHHHLDYPSFRDIVS